MAPDGMNRTRLERQFGAVPIDIAPLIDVVFQLLLFFMLTSSFILQPGIRIRLPEAASSQALTASTYVITLTKDHVIYWDEQVMTMQELIRQLRGGRGRKPILIRADRHAYVERLIELWDACREAGYREIHIATLPE